MSDRRENALPARVWALVLLLPALASFLGMLAKDYLAIRMLAPVSGDTVSVLGTMVAPMVMSILMAMLFLAVQIAIVGWIYRIGIFPITTTWRSADVDRPSIRTASTFTLMGVTIGIAFALWVEPFVFAGNVPWAGFTSFMVASALLAGLFVAPMIIRGERASTDREART